MSLSPIDRWLEGLPRRDLVLLPLLSAVAVCILLLCGEIGARLIWPENTDDNCEYSDKSNRVRFRPNCTSTYVTIDGGRASNTYNECGYRSPGSCSTELPGQLRVAVVGTSTSRGVFVEYPQTYPAQAVKLLDKLCGRPVDFQNLATEGEDFKHVPDQVEEALALKPDAIVETISDSDVGAALPNNPELNDEAKAPLSLKQRVLNQLHGSRFLDVVRYFRYKDQPLAIDSFLNQTKGLSDSLRSPLTPLWRDRVTATEKLLNSIAQTVHQAGIPFIAVFVPRREVAALAKSDQGRSGVDPFQLSRLIGSIASRAGIAYIDDTADYAAADDTDALFLIAGAHPAAAGHSIIAKTVVNALLRLPAFSSCGGARADAAAGNAKASNQ
jgi:hypothetical protein